MEQEGVALLRSTVPEDQITFRRSADMSYRRQGYELRVPIPPGRLGQEQVPAIRRAFEEVYKGIYGHIAPDVEIDVVSWRVVAQGPRPELRVLGTGPSPSPPSLKGARGKVGPETALKTHRPAYMPELDGFADVPVYDRYELAPGDAFVGPAIVEERESTVVIGPDARARVDEMLNLIVDLTST
jgi:N-methylhydantoinase A